MVTVSIRMCNPQGYAVFHAQVVPEVSGTFRTMGLSSRQSLEARPSRQEPCRRQEEQDDEGEGALRDPPMRGMAGHNATAHRPSRCVAPTATVGPESTPCAPMTSSVHG
jgi:hypothetical protein